MCYFEIREFDVGDIVQGINRDENAAFHPIVKLADYDADFFIGAMLTTANRDGNIQLANQYDLNGRGEAVSYFPTRLLLKRNDWGPYRKIGELVIDDLQLIQNTVGEQDPVTWEEAVREYLGGD